MTARPLFAAAFFALAVLSALPAGAAPVASAKESSAQPALSVGFDAKGVLRAATCAKAPCALGAGVDLKLPGAYAGSVAQTRLTVVPLGHERRAVIVTVPNLAPDRAWEAVIAAPPGGGAPLVIFAGETGRAQGQEGERRGAMVQVSDADERGARRILVGEQWEELGLCGRKAMLSPKLLVPESMKLVPAKLQRIPVEERAQATKLSAEPAEPATGASAPLLQPVGATSSLGDPRAAADGKLDTAWSEALGGSGKGEFVLLNAPGDLPLQGLELVFRPTAGEPARGTAPKQFWLVSNQRVFHVTVAGDGWHTPGSRYAVKFDVPLQTDCLALVLDTAADEGKDVAVTVAEISAQTQFASADVAALVAALAGGGERSQHAKAVLRSLGAPAFEAVAARFDELDEGGRREALDVMDAADCSHSVPVYLRALASPFEAHRIRSRDRLRRCGPIAAQGLAQALATSQGPALAELAGELAWINPDKAVTAILPLLEEREVARRRILRVALARASSSPLATPALRKALSDPSLPEVALLDVMRALGPKLVKLAPEAETALARIASPAAPFRVRYLRALPAGVLAPHSSAARSLVSSSLTREQDAHVRAQAARAVLSPDLFRRELEQALSDPEVRVREAAAQALSRPSGAFASRALLERLKSDRWPIVRAAAALALAEFGSDAAADAALGAGLEDGSWLVRRDVARALGQRRARGQASLLRERLSDRDERFEVRVAAARALGDVCDQQAADLLGEHARRLADPLAEQEVRSIALAALSSLAKLGVSDLKQRLAPLFDKNAPPGAQAAARGALETRPGCR